MVGRPTFRPPSSAAPNGSATSRLSAERTAEMVATSHEIDDDTAELALLSMHLDDEQRRLEAGMKLGWHPYHFPDEPDSKQ